MKIFPSIRTLFVLFAAVIFSGVAHSASAQPAETNARVFKMLAVHHVPSDIMAYWLDPAHHPAPAQFKKQLDADRPEVSAILQNTEPASESGKNTIISITSPQNALLIYADKTLFEHLLQEVTTLDKPIPGIEFEAKTVAVSKVEVSKQNTNTVAPDTNTQEWLEIPVKNIRPGLLAYWIDPAHFPKPAEYIKADDYMNQLLSKRAQESPQTVPIENIASANRLAKPLGTTIFADDADKVLWVRGTASQCDQLKKIVEFLDRPIRKIDIDFKMVEMDSTDETLIQNKPMLKMLFDASAKQVNYNGNQEVAATLNDLITNGTAKIVKSSQLTILNNLTDRYSTATSTPVTMNLNQSDNGNQVLSTETDTDNPLFLKKRLSVIFTPTLNNDDTITLFMTIGANAELTHKTSASDDQLWIQNLDNKKAFTTVGTIKNGDSLLFGGFNSTSLGLDNQNHPIVLWITAKIEE